MTTTLHDHLDAYLKLGRAKGRSPHTLRVHRFNILSFLSFLGGAYGVHTAERLRPEHLRGYQQVLSEHRTAKGHPLKPRSINKRVESVRCLLRYLIRQNLVHPEILDALQPVKVPKLLPGGTLTHRQTRKLLDHIPTNSTEGYRDRAMLEMLYSCGLRASELVGLTLSDIQFSDATARVMGKGRKERLVPIGRTALRCLESYVKAVRPFLVRSHSPRALFLNSRGGALRYHQLLRCVHRHARGAGLETPGPDDSTAGGVTPHTFRRSCTTELIRGGCSLYHAKELLGHETLDTLKHYARLNITDLKKAHARCHPRERDNSL